MDKYVDRARRNGEPVMGKSQLIGKSAEAKSPDVPMLALPGPRGGAAADHRQRLFSEKTWRWSWVVNAPFIVFDDARPDAAVASNLVANKSAGSGPGTCVPNRIFCPLKKIVDSFSQKLAERAKKNDRGVDASTVIVDLGR